MPPKGKTSRYISSDGKWLDVCFSCPLPDCFPNGPCPIKIALNKKIVPARMVEIERMAGPGQPKRFRKLIYNQQVT